MHDPLSDDSTTILTDPSKGNPTIVLRNPMTGYPTPLWEISRQRLYNHSSQTSSSGWLNLPESPLESKRQLGVHPRLFVSIGSKNVNRLFRKGLNPTTYLLILNSFFIVRITLLPCCKPQTQMVYWSLTFITMILMKDRKIINSFIIW